MVFPNLYYKRTAATAKACYICYKPTVTVLATIDTADFLYTCPIHLADRGFATRVPEPEPGPKNPSVSPEDISRAKQEWEEKQRQKKDKAQEKEDQNGKTDGAQKEGGEKEGDTGSKAGSAQDKKPAHTIVPAPSTSASEAPKPTHERYVLHRNIFALRTSDHRRRRQTAQAKSLAPRLPGAPSSLPPGP